MTWRTVPLCDTCWKAQNPGRGPIRLREPEPEPCYSCQEMTKSGIYIRADVNVNGEN
jgi:hypothetical protein